MGATKMQGRIDLHEVEYKLSDYPSRFLSPEQAIRFLVFQDGDDGKIKAKDGKTGRSYVGTDPETVIQYAADHLTSGRTYREKILVLGDYTIDTTINLSSYTILEIHGRLKLANGANKPSIAIPGGTVENPKVHIDILGGIWDGNKANQSATHRLIDASGVVKYFRVKECHFIDTYEFAIHTSPGSSFLYVIENRAETDVDTSGPGLIYADMTSEIFIQRNYCRGLDIDIRPITNPNGRCIVESNFIYGGRGGGITLLGGYELICTNNQINNKGLEGIESAGANRAVIANNQVYNCDTEALHAWGINDSLVAGNLFYNCGSDPPDGETKTAVIFLGLYNQPALRNLIIANKIYSNKTTLPQYGIYEFPSGDYNRIRCNTIEGFSVEKIHLSGANSSEKYND